MLFLTYWELDEKMAVADRQAAGAKLLESGLFPPDGVEVIRWDATPDGWGILICEADSAESISNALNLWRSVGTGFFKRTRTAPAVPVEQAMARGQEILDELASL